MILAGDIGGTKTNIGAFRLREGVPEREVLATYASADYGGLGPLVRAFLSEHAVGEVGIACFGVAGPVRGNTSATTNLPWTIDGDQVAREAGIPALVLINDLVATAEGIPALGQGEIAVLHEGREDPGGGGALIAAGTGLGMALLPRVGGEVAACPSEGGHMDFAPRNEEEGGLRRFLARRYGPHVSVERVVSGPGIRDIYHYLRQEGRAVEDPEIRRRMEEEDPSVVITEAGLEGRCALCVGALDLFVSAYGAAAGNLALVALATGGLWVGGGIAPKILTKLRGGAFLEALHAKGRFRDLLEGMPVRVILDPEAAVLGAARRGAKALLEGRS